METTFNINGTIDPVALYAAALSTIIAIWEVIKWRRRNQIKVTCTTNMLFFPSTDKNKYIVTTVINKGEFPTTITHLGMYYWKNRVDKFLNRNKKAFIVNSNQVPKIIGPGDQWMGQSIQNNDIERMASEGYLYSVVIHSMGEANLQRIRIQKKK